MDAVKDVADDAVEGLADDTYAFWVPEIWKEDARMTAFAKDLRDTNWEDVPYSDIKVLKLNHLLYDYDDEAEKDHVESLSGKNKSRNWIFLSPDAKIVWDYVFGRLFWAPSEPDSTGIPLPAEAFLTVSGNSGIGKSYSMVYPLKRFLESNEIVFFDLRDRGKLYAFVPQITEGKANGKYIVYRTELANNFKGGARTRLLRNKSFPPVLWDPAESEEENYPATYLRATRTAVAVSIQDELVKNAYKKYDVSTRYLSQWSLDQSEAVRRYCYQEITPLQIRYRYFRYGGIFRLLFATEAHLDEFNVKVRESIDALKQEELESILRGNVNGKFQTISSGVFKVIPDLAAPSKRRFDFGSPYTFALLARRFWQSISQYGKGQNPRYTEWFEAMAMLRLSEGGTFKVKRLDQKGADFEDMTLDQVPIKTFIPTNGKEVDNEGFYDAWAKSSGGEVLAPSWGTLPVVDCADKSLRGFNTTVTRSHGIEYVPCKRILEVHDAISKRRGNLQLYFAVPDWIANDFKEQSFDGVQRAENSGKNQIADRVEQYVLKIESDHIERLNEMFLNTEKTLRAQFTKRLEVTERFRKRRRTLLSSATDKGGTCHILPCRGF